MSHRNFVLVVAFLLLAFFFGTGTSWGAHYQVYLIGGQSNGTGRGDASKLTGPLAKPQPDVRFYWHRTMSADNVGHLEEDKWIDLAPGSGHGRTAPVNRKEFGCEVSFGRAMADAKPKEHIAIIKYTVGGTSLQGNWSEKGRLYPTFVSTVKAALKALKDEGHSYEVRGMLWAQGENDAGSAGPAKQYEKNLKALVGRVRKDLAAGEDLPFVISGLSNSQDKTVEEPGTPWFIVRKAQEKVAKDIVLGGFVNTDGFSTRTGEAIHFNEDGQISLGREFAKEMLRLEKESADRE